MTSITIPAGTTLFKDEVGHYNFHYPNEHRIFVLKPITMDVLSWMNATHVALIYGGKRKFIAWIEKETYKCIRQTNLKEQEQPTND